MLLKLQKLAEIMDKWALELPFAETYQKIRYIAIELPTKSSHGNDLDFKIMTPPSEPISADNLQKESQLADNYPRESHF